jgi:hypothetical protein
MDNQSYFQFNVQPETERFMRKVSTEDLEQKIEAEEEVIDRYFDATTT